jgi:hypothetical protein
LYYSRKEKHRKTNKNKKNEENQIKSRYGKKKNIKEYKATDLDYFWHEMRAEI